MEQERRDGMGRERGDYPLGLGLIASALLHVLFVFLSPPMMPPSYGAGGGAPSAPRAQFTVLSISGSDDEDPAQVEAAPRTIPPLAPRYGTPGAAPIEDSGPGRGTDAEAGVNATVAERLRSSARPFSARIPMRETANQRAIREARERVLRAGEELGPLPPNGVAASRGGRGSGAGISIPFGFKPPPPAQTVPAPPLPDSILRRDSLRAAALAAARSDSIRAARDTTRLRNVAPPRRIVIPRVVPDTTAGEQ